MLCTNKFHQRLARLVRIVMAVCGLAVGAWESAAAPPDHSPEFVQAAIADARAAGDARRGAGVFNAAASGCMACHKVAGAGGVVGPELTTVAKCLTPEEIVESLYWPARAVKPEYKAFAVTLTDGRVLQGIVKEESAGGILLVEASGRSHRITADEIDERAEVGSLMPANVFTALPAEQRRDLVRYLLELGRTPGLESLSHRPEKFDVAREPLRPEDWPNATAPINKHRLYDAYAKQAMQYRGREPMPLLLPAYPGLDGGRFGHWGSIPESTWRDDRRNQSDPGSLQCWPLAINNKVVPRAVNVRLRNAGKDEAADGTASDIAICFNPDTLAIEAAWTGGFLQFDAYRYGFLAPAKPAGKSIAVPAVPPRPEGPARYRGFHRHGDRVVFAYTIGGTDYLDAAWVEDGRIVREIAGAADHSLRKLTRGGPARWPQAIVTSGTLGTGSPYAVDTIAVPFDNPWKSLMFFGGLGFFSNGDAALCTIQGDVWRVDGIDAGLKEVRWRRIASGLNQALGLVVVDDVVHVLGGDQITRLVDFDGDGEADFYECVSNAFQPSGGHSFK